MSKIWGSYQTRLVNSNNRKESDSIELPQA